MGAIGSLIFMRVMPAKLLSNFACVVRGDRVDLLGIVSINLYMNILNRI